MQKTLNIFQEKLNNELKDLDKNSLYEELDILGSIPEYDIIQSYICDETKNKKERDMIEKSLERLEKLCLKKNKMIKLKGEDKSYYSLIGEPYDLNGELISDYYEDFLEDDNIFCEYNGDAIYAYIEKILENKVQRQIYSSYNKEEC